MELPKCHLHSTLELDLCETKYITASHEIQLLLTKVLNKTQNAQTIVTSKYPTNHPLILTNMLYEPKKKNCKALQFRRNFLDSY